MDALRSLLFNLSFYVVTLALALGTIPASLLFGAKSVHWFFRAWCSSVMWLFRWVLGAQFSVEGLDNIPEGGPKLIVSKHQSELDVALLGHVFPNYAGVAMRELDNYPLVGRIVSQLGHMKVTVSGAAKNQLPEVIAGAKRVHSEGRPIAIFPEGTLMEAGTKLRYRSGVWHIYNELGIPATPVALSLGLPWPQRQWRKHPVKGTMKFLKPIPPGLPRGEFMALLEETIETESNALIRRDADPERLRTIVFEHEINGNGWTNVRDDEAKAGAPSNG